MAQAFLQKSLLAGIGISLLGKNMLNAEEQKGPNAIYALDTKTMKQSLVVRDDNVDPGSLLYPNNYLRSPLDGSLFAIVFWDGYPWVHYLDPENPFANEFHPMVPLAKYGCPCYQTDIH